MTLVFIPGTNVPIGAVHAQQAAEDDEAAFLVLLTDGDSGTSAHSKGLHSNMAFTEFAVLEFARFKRSGRTVYRLAWNDQSLGPLEQSELSDARARATAEIKLLNEASEAEARRRQEEWLARHVRVEMGSEVVQVGTFKKEQRHFESVTVDGVTDRVGVGEGAARASKLAERAIPLPEPHELNQSSEFLPEVRSWQGSWTTSSGSRALVVPDSLTWWTIPTAWVIAELEARASERWTLIDVSADKGLYSGGDARLEAGPVSLRYLFGRES